MEKVRLNLEALEVVSFATTDAAPEAPGTVRAHEMGQIYVPSIKHCYTPNCTYTTCI
jgi:hypothetical protein